MFFYFLNIFAFSLPPSRWVPSKKLLSNFYDDHEPYIIEIYVSTKHVKECNKNNHVMVKIAERPKVATKMLSPYYDKNNKKIHNFIQVSHINERKKGEKNQHYSLIEFDERVTVWLQRVQSLPCACAYVALFARRLAYNHYAIAHAYNAPDTHAQGSAPEHWSQKVTLSSKAIRV